MKAASNTMKIHREPKHIETTVQVIRKNDAPFLIEISPTEWKEWKGKKLALCMLEITNPEDIESYKPSELVELKEI